VIEDLITGKKTLAVVGLGYVGLPLAIEFGKAFKSVIGFDISENRINKLKNYIDVNGETSVEELKKTTIQFTSDPATLKESSIIIVAVPTPITHHKAPDLMLLESASKIVGVNMSQGTVVVYESTVYPGVTEDICVPILERCSGLKYGVGFKAGYSPERINPGDKEHALSKVVKIVSGCDNETTDLLAQVYGAVVKAGVYKAPDIKTAEAAKVIENIQRDLNIALMNELSVIFHMQNLDTKEVLKAASTKWNFLGFEPGLVGGHCIGVDPYYLTFKAQEMGYHPEVILAGRKINDNMGKYVAEQTVKQLIKAGKTVNKCKVLVLGITFKENVRDIRNSRVIDIINELKDYNVNTIVHDPYAIKEDVLKEYGVELSEDFENLKPFDGIVAAVKHRDFVNLDLKYLKSLCLNPCVLTDVKGIYNKENVLKTGFNYWRL
jgi:UDP-N-acetyl-D-galactosamine dehydrogenase